MTPAKFSVTELESQEFKTACAIPRYPHPFATAEPDIPPC